MCNKLWDHEGDKFWILFRCTTYAMAGVKAAIVVRTTYWRILQVQGMSTKVVMNRREGESRPVSLVVPPSVQTGLLVRTSTAQYNSPPLVTEQARTSCDY